VPSGNDCIATWNVTTSAGFSSQVVTSMRRSVLTFVSKVSARESPAFS
jgi:hypothetical protein